MKENQEDLLNELILADEVICNMCKKVNPQHSKCTICDERETRLAVITKAKIKGE